MSSTTRWGIRLAWCAAALTVAGGITVGCGGEPPPPPKPVPQPAPPPPPPEPEPEPEPEPSASASVEEPPPAPRKSSGRPLILMGPKKSISNTFGATPGAKLKLLADGGIFTLVIPEFALRTGINLNFKIGSPLSKPKHPLLGSLVEIEPIRVMGTKATAMRLDTGDKPFEFHVPLAGRDTVNLAIGAKDGLKVTWTVIEPKSIYQEMKGDKSVPTAAIFHSSFIAPGWVHATSAAPTAAAGE